MTNLYEQLGGEAAIDAAVEIFYQNILRDPRIQHFFSDIDMKRQIQKQKAFLTLAFGGPQIYKGRSMTAAHARLVQQGLNDRHFDAVLENLSKTLQQLDIAADLIQQSLRIAESTRDDVLGRSSQRVELHPSM